MGLMIVQLFLVYALVAEFAAYTNELALALADSTPNNMPFGFKIYGDKKYNTRLSIHRDGN